MGCGSSVQSKAVDLEPISENAKQPPPPAPDSRVPGSEPKPPPLTQPADAAETNQGKPASPAPTPQVPSWRGSVVRQPTVQTLAAASGPAGPLGGGAISPAGPSRATTVQPRSTTGDKATLAWIGEMERLSEALEDLESSIGQVAFQVIELLQDLATLAAADVSLSFIATSVIETTKNVRDCRFNFGNCARLLERMVWAGFSCYTKLPDGAAAHSDPPPDPDRLDSIRAAYVESCRVTGLYAKETWWKVVMQHGSSREELEALDRAIRHPAMINLSLSKDPIRAPFAWGVEDSVRVHVGRRARQLAGRHDVDVAGLVDALVASASWQQLLDLLPESPGADGLLRALRESVTKLLPPSDPQAPEAPEPSVGPTPIKPTMQASQETGEGDRGDPFRTPGPTAAAAAERRGSGALASTSAMPAKPKESWDNSQPFPLLGKILVPLEGGGEAGDGALGAAGGGGPGVGKLKRGISAAILEPVLSRLPPGFRELWTKNKDMFEDFCSWHKLRMGVIAAVRFLEERVKQLSHVDGHDPEGGILVGEFLEKILKRHLDSDLTERAGPHELLSLWTLCQGYLDRTHREGKSLLLFEGDEEGSVAWCVSLARQAYDTEDLSMDKDKALSELRYLLRPAPVWRDVCIAAAPVDPGTCHWLLSEFDRWFYDRPTERALILTGPPGSGRSSFLAALGIRRKEVVKAVLMQRGDLAERRGAAFSVRSLAMQLAQSVPTMWFQVLKGARMLAVDADTPTLFTRLLSEPISRLGDDIITNKSGIVIVIDGLDEGTPGDGTSGSGQGYEAARVLCERLAKLPPWVRFVVSTTTASQQPPGAAPVVAPAWGAIPALVKATFEPAAELSVGPGSTDYNEDMRVVVQKLLKPILPDDCTEDSLSAAVAAVQESAQGSFVYVRHVFQELLRPAAEARPGGRITPDELLLPGLLPKGLDSLYSWALTRRLDKTPDARRLLEVLIVARDNPSVPDLAALCGMHPDSEAFLEALYALVPFVEVHGPQWSEKRVRCSHWSVGDFLAEPARAKELHLDPSACSRRVVASALRIVRARLGSAPFAEPMLTRLPAYVVRHSISHALGSGAEPSAEELLMDVRFFKALAEERRVGDLCLELLQWLQVQLRGPGPQGMAGLADTSSSALSKLGPSPALGEFTRWLLLLDPAILHATPNAVFQAFLQAPSASWVFRAAEPVLRSMIVDTLPLRGLGRSTFVLPKWKPASFPTGPLFAVRDRALSAAESLKENPRGARASEGAPPSLATLQASSSISRGPAVYGHNESINQLLFDGDRAHCLSCSIDASLIVWDAALGKPVRVLRGHTNGVVGASWSPDGARILSGSTDTTAIVWDSTTGKSLERLSWNNDMIHIASFSPDGSRFLLATLRQLSVWDATGPPFTKLCQMGAPNLGASLTAAATTAADQASTISFAVWSTDSKQIVSASQAKVSQWSAEDGSLLAESATLAGPVACMTLSPDGALLLVGTTAGEVCLMDSADGLRLRWRGGHRSGIRCLAWSPDSSLVVSGAFDSTLSIWDVATGAKVQDVRCSGARLACFFSTDGSRIVSFGGEPFLVVHSLRRPDLEGSGGEADGNVATTPIASGMASVGPGTPVGGAGGVTPVTPGVAGGPSSGSLSSRSFHVNGPTTTPRPGVGPGPFEEVGVVRSGVVHMHVLSAFMGFLDAQVPDAGARVLGMVTYDQGRGGGIHVVSGLRFLVIR